MQTLFWIIVSGLLMSMIALIGSLTLFLKAKVLKKILLPLVALSAGSLLGGAFFHMLPEAIEKGGNRLSLYVWLVFGFVLFFILEQFLHWQHSHRRDWQQDLSQASSKRPFIYMILIADGLHNFLGGLAIGGAFIMDIRLGWTAWLAAAAHEIPQELGDFAVLLHGGFHKRKALFFNFLSGLSFLLGGLLAYFISFEMDITFLVPLAAGNFIYIAAADLIPEIKHLESAKARWINLIFFSTGLLLLYYMR